MIKENGHLGGNQVAQTAAAFLNGNDTDHTTNGNGYQDEDLAKLALLVEQADRRADVEAYKAEQREKELEKFFLDTEATDYGNAVCVDKLFSGKFARNEAFGLMYYDGCKWTSENADAYLGQAIIETLRRRAHLAIDHKNDALLKKSIASNANVTACKARFKDFTHIYVSTDAFNVHDHLLNVANGVVDLRTGGLLPHSPAYYFTQCIRYEYFPNANQKPWLDYLASVVQDFSDKEIADYVKMSFGYSITGSTREQCLFFLHGAQGRNGKGTVMDVIQELLGDYSGACSFNTLTRNREGDQGFDLAPLYKMRCVVASESGKSQKLNESKVKEITGQDTISASFKGKDIFHFKPKFKIWALSNHPPQGDVDDNAFWARLRMISFPHSFEGKEDKGLRDRLTQPEVLQGVLAWCVEGAVMWYALGSRGLRTPTKMQQSLQEVRDQLDTVKQWIENDCTIDDRIPFCSNSVLYKSYKAWCEDNDVAPKAKVWFGRSLTAKGFRPARTTTDRGIAGIKPKDA